MVVSFNFVDGVSNMYSPCFECMNRYGRQYTKECDSKCDYANVMSKLKPYGTIDEIVEVMQGKRVPITMLNEENIEGVYRVVYAAKHGII